MKSKKIKESHARKYKIKEICDLVKGKYPTLKTKSGIYPLVVTAENRRSADSYQLEGPAVCIPLISSTGHGNAAINRIHYQEGKFALANLLVALIPKYSNLLNAKYLYYMLTARKDDSLVPLMRGSANVSLKEQDIANLEVPVATFSKQIKTVTYLEKLLPEIKKSQEKSYQTYLLLKKLRQNIMDLAITSQLRGDQKQILVSSKFYNLMFEDRTEAKSIKKFTIKKLGEISEYRYGYTSKSSTNKDGVPYLRITDINNNSTLKDERVYVKINEQDFQKFKLKKDDIVIARSGATVGKSFLFNLDADFIFASYLIRFRPNTNIVIPKFLFFILNSSLYWDYIKKRQTIAAQPNINARALSEFEFFIPSIGEQELIVKRIESLLIIHNRIEENHKIILEHLTKISSKILSECFQD